MAQYILLATLCSEETADRFLTTLVRRGTAVSTLGDRRDPIVPGSHGAMLVIQINTTETDIRKVNAFVRAEARPHEWVSLVVLPAEDVTSLLWTCRGEGKGAPSLLDDSTNRDNEDAWFAAGEQLQYEFSEES